MINSTRRAFCKQTAAATTGILASTLPLDAMSNVYDNKKLKLALVGCGGRGSGIKNRHNWDCYLVDDKEYQLTVEDCKLIQNFPKNFI